MWRQASLWACGLLHSAAPTGKRGVDYACPFQLQGLRCRAAQWELAPVPGSESQADGSQALPQEALVTQASGSDLGGHGLMGTCNQEHPHGQPDKPKYQSFLEIHTCVCDLGK